MSFTNRICRSRLRCDGEGQRRELIFRSEADRSDFLELLGRACQRYGWTVIGYVLMGNHYHLLLETAEPNLSQRGVFKVQC